MENTLFLYNGLGDFIIETGWRKDIQGDVYSQKYVSNTFKFSQYLYKIDHVAYKYSSEVS